MAEGRQHRRLAAAMPSVRVYPARTDIDNELLADWDHTVERGAEGQSNRLATTD